MGTTTAPQVGGGGSQYGEGAFAALKRNGSWAADAVKKPASQLASSVTLEAVGSAAQRAGGGLAVVGGVASTVAKVRRRVTLYAQVTYRTKDTIAQHRGQEGGWLQ